MNEQDFDRACRFLDKLAATLQRYGVSSFAMQSQLERVAHALHLEGQFVATPTQVQSVLSDDEDHQRLHISALSAGNYDMTKLAQLAELISQVESGAKTPVDGLAGIRAIERADPEYGPRMDALAFALCGVGFAVILGLSWLDVALAGALSVMTFGLTRLAARSQGLATALELVAGAVACALATLLAHVFPGSSPLAVAVCACVYFVPGFGLTLGASELMNGNTLSGLIGFTRAVVSSVKLVVGGLIGSAMALGLVSVAKPDTHSGVPHAWAWLFVPLLVLGLAILFRVRRRDLPWPVLGGILVWLGLEAGTTLGFWQGTFIGAFLLVFASNVFARYSGLPAPIILLPAVMLLVPGVAALEALYIGQSEGLVEGIRAVSRVLALVAAILGGVVLAEAAWTVRTVAISTVTSGRSRGRSEHR